MQELKEKLRQAEQNFNYANQEYIDVAIYELNAAEERFRAMIREVKMMTIEEAIKKLKELRLHCQEYATAREKDGEFDTVWHEDIKALDIAIEKLGGAKR